MERNRKEGRGKEEWVKERKEGREVEDGRKKGKKVGVLTVFILDRTELNRLCGPLIFPCKLDKSSLAGDLPARSCWVVFRLMGSLPGTDYRAVTFVIILYPECQCHYPVPQVSASSSCTPSVSVIILYPECQRHYPVPRVSVSLSCTPSVSVIILYPECQCHYPVPRVSASLSCTPSVSVIILYPKCQRHYPVTPGVSVIILYPECQCHYPVPRVSVSLSRSVRVYETELKRT
ncbi:unnamed protein product [Ranitomeya imitator]|uniref:Uncharacterized protein n=1 Tax=Ranitomeya imitator TaxID=111125 RepID=A0ABN9LVZ5_9NEOB|nr:unnamed protein product [Ranitomeya imitator]